MHLESLQYKSVGQIKISRSVVKFLKNTFKLYSTNVIIIFYYYYN